MAKQSHLEVVNRGGDARDVPDEKLNLFQALFKNKDFSGRHFHDSDFKEADLSGATLEGTRFWRADLQSAKLGGSKLAGAQFRGADLSGANLVGAKGLLSHQLGGTIVVGAHLPEGMETFAGLARVKDISGSSRATFLSSLLVCIYLGLTLGTVRDPQLLLNSSTSKLPIISASLPIVGFFYAAPILLFALFCYLCLSLQRLWESLADLPAVFPDSVRLDKKVDPWLFNGLVNRYFFRLRQGAPRFSGFQSALSILLAYWIVPVTLFAVWWRCLHRHDLLLSSAQSLLLASSVFVAILFQRLCGVTLMGGEEAAANEQPLREKESAEPPKLRGRRWIKAGLQRLGLNTSARLAFAVAFSTFVLSSASPWGASWKGFAAADLRNTDLRYADFGAADLTGALLDGANLYGTDFRQTTGLTPRQVRSSKAWKKAFFPTPLVRGLGLPPDHNCTLAAELAAAAVKECGSGSTVSP